MPGSILYNSENSLHVEGNNVPLSKGRRNTNKSFLKKKIANILVLMTSNIKSKFPTLDFLICFELSRRLYSFLRDIAPNLLDFEEWAPALCQRAP